MRLFKDNMSEKQLIRTMVRNAVVAALYFALTVALAPISYGAIQVRIAELLMLLCFFRKDYIFGLTLGCLLSNVFSSLGPFDMLFGTLATFLACGTICFCRQLVLAAFMPVIFNGLIIGAEIYFLTDGATWEHFFIFAGEVALGELIALTVGYIIFMIFGKKVYFQNLIGTSQNFNFKF